jgi:hypothetical protein
MQDRSRNKIIYGIKLSYYINKRSKNSATFIFERDHFTEHVCLLKNKKDTDVIPTKRPFCSMTTVILGHIH